jgi:hypothetical protein
MATISRTTIAPGLMAAAFLVSGCQLGQQPPQTSSLQAADPRNEAEERKDEMMRQLAHCETGGFGPSERPIYGGRGAYLGRMQFSVQTVVSYQMRKDGTQLSRQEAAALAHDYDRASALAKFMIFDLEEPWHWPLCAKKISLREEMANIKELTARAEAAKAANADAAKVETAKAQSK